MNEVANNQKCLADRTSMAPSSLFHEPMVSLAGRAAAVAAILVMAVGGLVLLGWELGIPVLKRIAQG